MLRNPDDVINAIQAGKLKEHLHLNLELKEDWAQRHGDKISALANKVDQIVCFMVLGVSDSGQLMGLQEKWAKQTEQILSQHINSNLDPVQACCGISCREISNSWVIILTIRNPGEVTYWAEEAHQASGTTIEVMKPDQILKLRIQLPGLTDYTKQYYKCQYDEELIKQFKEQVATRRHPLETAGQADADGLQTLRNLGMHERQASRILFGPCPFRIIEYDFRGEPIANKKVTGLYRILRPDFISQLAANQDCHYSERALKEGFANAVAHAAYFEGDGEIMLEIHPHRIVVSNLCIKESTYFANRWFSRSHKTINGLLMEVLRVAGSVDELGRGKHLIFSQSIELGQSPPEVIIEKAGKYERWKLVIHGANPQPTMLRLLQRIREIYKDERKALIAQALVLWRDRPVQEIRNFVDGDFARQFAEVLSGIEGPIFYDEKEDRITLRRWAEVLIGEGKDSKDLSPGEEERLQSLAYDLQSKYNNGIITPKDLRELCPMGNTKSEQVLSSSILKRWHSNGIVERLGHGKYKFVTKVQIAPTLFDDIMKILSPGATTIEVPDFAWPKFPPVSQS
jgi:predicted HTH transcriptional regulator